MTQKIIEVPGVGVVEFPDSMSDEAIAAVIKTQMMGKTPPSGPSPDNRTGRELAIDKIKNIPGQAARFFTGMPSAALAIAKIPAQVMTGQREAAMGTAKGAAQGIASPVMTPLLGAMSGRKVQLPMAGGPTVQFPEFEEGNPASPKWDQAQESAVQMAVGAGLSKTLPAVMSKIPRSSRAAAKFDEIMKVAKDVPIDTSAAQQVVNRAMELSERGSTKPKIMKDFVKATDATKPPMTYAEGRDFASNAGALSAKEATRLNAKMQRQVVQFSKAMKEANREAAVKVGMGEVYDAAMKEYRQAKTLSQAAKVLAKWGAVAAGAYQGYRMVQDIQK